MSADRGTSARVAFECDCGVELEVALVDGVPCTGLVICATCTREQALHAERVDQVLGLLGCVRCGHPELYTIKRFPRTVGIAIVVVAAVLAPLTSYLSLVAAAALDFVLYRFVPEIVVCYVCGARHRGFASQPRHPRYDREIAERLRYGARAVMGKPMRAGGTANAPDPEH